MLSVAGVVLDQMFRSVGRSGCGVILSDATGVILDRRVAGGDAQGFAAAGLVEGACWSEAVEGTNGIGTCLFEGAPVIIHRDQHFASRNIGISCVDAPVHDPHGRLVAALDVSSCREDHGPAMAEMIAALVRDAARRIEREYFCRHFADARIVFLSDDTGTALLAADRDDLVIGATRAARMQLGLDDTIVSEQRPINQLLGLDAAPSFEAGDRAVLRRALASTGGNVSEAARLLGIGRATFYRRMSRAGLNH
jgi:transcriptional regulator of acetoin/glycerol metabolism